LAGAIEKEVDAGTGWRAAVQHELVDLKVQWLDPTNKPVDFCSETPELSAQLHYSREHGLDTAVREIMRAIRAVDLRMVDVSDFIIVNIDPAIPTFGTHEEIDRAQSQNKPVLVRIEGGRHCAPLWWFDKLDSKLFFSTWESLYAHLRYTATNNMSDEEFLRWCDYKWILFNWTGENV
jgi:hypothetical protein